MKTRAKRLFKTKKSPLTVFVHKHFISPVEAMLGVTTEDALSMWLGIKYRDMYFCKAEIAFKMMGKEMLHPSEKKWHYGTINRAVKRGQSLIVRVDKRTPNRVDVDLNLGEEVRTFTLNNAEYELLREKLEVLY